VDASIQVMRLWIWVFTQNLWIMDMDTDVKFHIHGKPSQKSSWLCSLVWCTFL